MHLQKLVNNSTKLNTFYLYGKYEKIGDRQYDQRGIKIGKWLRIWVLQINHLQWRIQYEESERMQIEYFSLGKINVMVAGHIIKRKLRLEKWVELGKEFEEHNYVIYYGEYNMKDKGMEHINKLVVDHMIKMEYKILGNYGCLIISEHIVILIILKNITSILNTQDINILTKNEIQRILNIYQMNILQSYNIIYHLIIIFQGMNNHMIFPLSNIYDTNQVFDQHNQQKILSPPFIIDTDDNQKQTLIKQLSYNLYY
ncbi:unnamed protein product [Paramecium sonneborni]|uniref:Uncharacterized protein n=1 Tax=Paramecium sonneborni TaxID=65129 RepID=A0A8S1RS29_9CILI|nr:unnamed protein product [Paramecium sonneborni]